MLRSMHNARPFRDKSERRQETWMSSSVKAANFLPGLVIGFLLGLWVELPKNFGRSTRLDTSRTNKSLRSDGNGDEVKMAAKATRWQEPVGNTALLALSVKGTCGKLQLLKAIEAWIPCFH
eukprot:Gb_27661 [translate_table: standard]